MAKVLNEYFGEVRSSDIHNYGYGHIADFLAGPYEASFGHPETKTAVELLWRRGPQQQLQNLKKPNLAGA